MACLYKITTEEADKFTTDVADCFRRAVSLCREKRMCGVCTARVLISAVCAFMAEEAHEDVERSPELVQLLHNVLNNEFEHEFSRYGRFMGNSRKH